MRIISCPLPTMSVLVAPIREATPPMLETTPDTFRAMTSVLEHWDVSVPKELKAELIAAVRQYDGAQGRVWQAWVEGEQYALKGEAPGLLRWDERPEEVRGAIGDFKFAVAGYGVASSATTKERKRLAAISAFGAIFEELANEGEFLEVSTLANP
jgi:hypothetical protein